MDNHERTTKVKHALLAMQRFAWEQGVTAQAFLELGERDWVILLAKDAVNRQIEDGRLAFMGEGSVTDPAANGEALVWAAKITGDPVFEQAARKMLDWLLRRAPKNKEGVLYHVVNKAEVWVDSFYMAPPFLASMGCYAEALHQIAGYRRYLWNSKKHLYAHKWDDAANAFVRPDCWGVGNGWAAAGMARVINLLPDTLPDEKTKLSGYVREAIDGCLAYQREDGLFHDVVDQPETFVETNLAQMLSYTIYRGVAGGWLERGYLRQAETMRAAVYQKVDACGLVQGVCGAPHFDQTGTAPEGQAFFLLMEAAARDYENAPREAG
jgi:unsaturated rhamnogalacturonyl hydrolase